MEGIGFVGMKMIDPDIWARYRIYTDSWITGNHDLRDTHAGDRVDAFLYSLKNFTSNVKLSDKIIDLLKGEEKMNKNELLKDVDKIVITKDGDKKVLCRAYSGNRVVNTYDASCSPDDIFDFNIGAKLAMDRLYEGYDMTPKPKKTLFTGSILIRYEADGKKWNKVYSINKGKGVCGNFTISNLCVESFYDGVYAAMKEFNDSLVARWNGTKIVDIIRIDE